MFHTTARRGPRLRMIGIGLALAAVPLAVVAVSVWPSQAATTPVGGGVYTLASAASGKCVDVVGASTANSALLVQVACNQAAADQQWQVVARTSGQFNLVNAFSTRCGDVPSGATTSGLQLQQYGCGDGTKVNQLWTFSASTAATGKYLIKSVASGLCVSDLDGSTAGNNPIVQETCSDLARMQWSFNYVSGSTATPTATATTGTPTVAADGTGKYRTVQAAIDAVPTGNTSRAVITIKAGTYREIVTVPSNKPYITLQGLGAALAAGARRRALTRLLPPSPQGVPMAAVLEEKSPPAVVPTRRHLHPVAPRAAHRPVFLAPAGGGAHRAR